MDFPFLSDTEIEIELGKRLKKRRVAKGLNQSELAEAAGVARRTITGVENGDGCGMRTFIALLRALGALPELEALLQPPPVSPIALSTQRIKERKNPYKPRRKKTPLPQTPAPWKWGDEAP